MEIPTFRYMAWAKTDHPKTEFPLHQSGMAVPDPAAVGLAGAPPTLAAPPGAREAAAAVAERYGVPEECVFPTCGTHHANFLVARSLVGPGDRVAVETPTYEDLPGVFGLVGAEVLPLHRRRETRWRVDAGEVRAALERGARAVVLSDLHNPSGARLGPEVLAALDAAARKHDAWIVIDEVFLDFTRPPAKTAFHPGGRFITTASITKVWGLGDVRFGWTLADPAVIDRVRRLNDWIVVNPPAPATGLVMRAWPHLEAAAERHRELAGRNARVVATWVRERNDVAWSEPDAGIAGYLEVPALAGRDDVAWVEELTERSGVRVAPGSFFAAPPGFRLGFGIATDRLQEALERLGAALDELTATGSGD